MRLERLTGESSLLSSPRLQPLARSAVNTAPAALAKRRDSTLVGR